MKPDWKDAPEWANWLTYDLHGWYWHEDEPELEDEEFPDVFNPKRPWSRTENAGSFGHDEAELSIQARP